MAAGNYRPGFLLMEAIAAIFLLSIMATVVGGYWHHMASARALTQRRMEALAIAGQLIDQCCTQQLSWDAIPARSGRFSITSNKKNINVVGFSGALRPVLITLTVRWQDLHKRHELQCSGIAVEGIA